MSGQNRTPQRPSLAPEALLDPGDNSRPPHPDARQEPAKMAEPAPFNPENLPKWQESSRPAAQNLPKWQKLAVRTERLARHGPCTMAP